jgi:ABC-type nickel/cobalt efflux system permease component RcnA
MKRLALLITVVAALVAAAPAAAHPLGNFSVNHITTVSVSSDRVDVRYVLDQAEIPTFQERGSSRAEVLAAKLGELRSRLEVTADGRRLPLAVKPGAVLTHPRGQGGLPTTRLVVSLTAPMDGVRRVAVHDGTFPGRVGWKAVVAAPGSGTAVRSTAPSGDPTDGLRGYPKDLLSSPLDRRDATLSVRAGDGTLVAPKAEGGDFATTTDRGGGDGFAGVFDRAAAGEGVLLLLFLAAFGWGALHALSPGHGKAMVAAYLVGTRGTAKHALALGATVTITHTIGVFALGVVTLALSAYVLPEDLYPWLELSSGLLVVLVGAGVLRSRIRAARSKGHTHHHHDHDHDHGDHDHHHHHHGPESLTWKGLIGLGASAGLLPCPSALVVLLAALSQHEVGLGLALIVAFSLGLAATLSGLGLVVVHAGKALTRATSGRPLLSRLAAAAPAASAVVIVVAGLMLTARALPGVT